MILVFRLAVRQVFRQKSRSFLTALSLFFATYIVALTFGWAAGMITAYIDNFTMYQTGHLRITSRAYLDRERFLPVDALISDSVPLSRRLAGLSGVRSVEERIRFGLLLGHGAYSYQAMGMGLNLFDNRLGLKDRLIEGRVSEAGLVIGEGLAETLHVSVGDRLLLVSKTSEGGLNGIKLPITGVFQLKNKLFDNKVFFIALDQARRLLKLGNYGTELYVYTDSEALTLGLQSQIQGLVSEDLVVETMEEQLGSLYQWMELSLIIIYFFLFLILILASFVVINTMMMAIFERFREIGTLRALGMKKRTLFTQLIIEGALIGAMGSIPGAVLGYVSCRVLAIHGIDYGTEMEMVDIPIEYIIRPDMSVSMVFLTIIMGVLITALTTIYPAYYASKCVPSEALKKV